METSVIIANHNYGKYLARAIRSVVDQHYDRNKFDVVVVDDASDDYSREVIASFGNLVRPILLDRNVGLGAARNMGIREALGRYVVNLDADDYLHADLLYVEALFLNLNAEYDAVACDYILVNEREEHMRRVDARASPIACGVMFRKEKIIEIGLYDEHLRLFEDEDLRIRAASTLAIGHIELPLYRYRQHDGNMTKNARLVAEYREKLERKHKRGSKRTRRSRR